MLKKALAASPVSHIGPDFPPAALFGGLGMVRVDIPYNQTVRTFETCNRYGADCFQFTNTNGEYGRMAPVVKAICGFFDSYLKKDLPYQKAVAVPGSTMVMENYCDRKLDYAPFVEKDGAIYVSETYIEDFLGVRTESSCTVIDGRNYVKADDLEGTAVGYKYYPDKNKCVLVPGYVFAGNKPKSRTY